MKRILLPLDGSVSAERVLGPAARIARRFGAELVLVHLLERNAPKTVHGQSHLRDPGAAETYLRGIADSGLFAGVRVSVHVHGESVDDLAGGIVSHAEELASDLVLLTVHGITGFTGRFHGNIAQHALFQGSGPVLLFKGEAKDAEADFRKILVPLDGDPAHEIVLPLALDWALAYGAEIHLVRVLGTAFTFKERPRLSARLMPSASEEVAEMEGREGLAYLDGASLPLRRAGVPVRIGILRGSVASKVGRYAKAEGIDLLMLGSHARFGTSAFWMESVGQKLMNRLSVPVLVCPACAERP